MKNIILVGMPACGKSTVGVVLAKTMNKSFLDTDLLIQEKAGMKLQDIINEKGNDYFHKLEDKVLKEVSVTNTIISTGGSAIYYEEAMKHLKEGGKVVYIRVALETVENRLNNIKTRGVIFEDGETLSDLYDKRIPLYEKYADIIIEGDNLDVEGVVEGICNNWV